MLLRRVITRKPCNFVNFAFKPLIPLREGLKNVLIAGERKTANAGFHVDQVFGYGAKVIDHFIAMNVELADGSHSVKAQIEQPADD